MVNKINNVMEKMEIKDEKMKNETENDPTKMGVMEKIRYMCKNITVEPIVLCYIMPSVLASLAAQNLNLEKACRVKLDYGNEVCAALMRRETANYKLEEQTVQKAVASMLAWKTVLQSGIPAMLILFWGSWSDRHRRRKPCILLPMFGELCTSLGLLLNVYFKNWPMEVAGVTEAIFPALSGSWFTFLVGIFCYIADVTTKEERTVRIGVVNMVFSISIPIGLAGSGILLRKVGFYGIFSISAAFCTAGILYVIFIFKEVPQREKSPEMKEAEKKPFLVDFFDRKHIVETFKVALKAGENRRRIKVIMIMLAIMVLFGPIFGEMAVTYLYTRYQFNWSEVEFSLYSTYASVTHLCGTALSLGIFSHLLKWPDALLGVLSSCSKIVASFVFAFAQKPWQLYAGCMVEVFGGTGFIALRSMSSKLVGSDELGKVNSLIAVAEALMPLAYAPLYTTVYSATINILPGAFFLMGGFLIIPAVVIFIWFYRVHRQEDKIKAAEAEKSDRKNVQKPISTIELEIKNSGHANQGFDTATEATR